MWEIFKHVKCSNLNCSFFHLLSTCQELRIQCQIICHFRMDICASLYIFLSLVFPCSLCLSHCGLCMWAVSLSEWVWDDAVCKETGETMLMILNLATLSNPPNTACSLENRASWNNYTVTLGETRLWAFACICLYLYVHVCDCMSMHSVQRARYVSTENVLMSDVSGNSNSSQQIDVVQAQYSTSDSQCLSKRYEWAL